MNRKLTEKMEIVQGKGRCEACQNIEKSEAAVTGLLKKNNVGQATVIIWQINKIIWGNWDGSTLSLVGGEPLKAKLWQELRVFNETEELHLVCAGNLFTGRFRTDADGGELEYIDTLSRLWGEVASGFGENVVVEDKNRKLRMDLPRLDLAGTPKYLGLVTRNYVGINEITAQAGYTDCRFVKITAADM